MPRNKRPRKPYRPKPVRYTCYDPALAQRNFDELADTELGAYLSLQAGTATRQQIACIRDVINLATVLWAFRAKELAEYGDGKDLLDAACPALVSLVDRCRKLRGPDCDRFAATAEELRAIQSAVAWASDIARDRIKAEYRFTQKVFLNLCHRLGKSDGPDLVNLDKSILMQLANYEPWPDPAGKEKRKNV